MTMLVSVRFNGEKAIVVSAVPDPNTCEEPDFTGTIAEAKRRRAVERPDAPSLDPESYSVRVQRFVPKA
jgi:hypothetical protein